MELATVQKDMEHRTRMHDLELKEKELKVRALEAALETERQRHTLEMEKMEEELASAEEDHYRILAQVQETYEQELEIKDERIERLWNAAATRGLRILGNQD